MLPLTASPLVSETDHKTYLSDHGIKIEGQAGSAVIVCNDGRRLKVSVIKNADAGAGAAGAFALSDAQWVETAEKVAIILAKKGLLEDSFKQSNFIINKEGITLPDAHNRLVKHDDDDDENDIENTKSDYEALYAYLNGSPLALKDESIDSKKTDSSSITLTPPTPALDDTDEIDDLDDDELPVDEDVDDPKITEIAELPIQEDKDDDFKTPQVNPTDAAEDAKKETGWWGTWSTIKNTAWEWFDGASG